MTFNRVAGWAVWVLGLLTLIGLLMVEVRIHESLGTALEQGWTYLLTVVSLIGLGGLTIARTNNRVGWLFAVSGLALAMGELAGEYVEYAGRSAHPSGSLVLVAAWASNWLWVPGFGALTTLLPLWFPTGRPPSAGWRFIERASLGLIVPLAVLLAFAGDPESVSSIRNPLEVEWFTRVADSISPVLGPLFPLLVATCAASLVVRFRRARGDERQQIKWFMSATILTASYMIVDTVISNTGLEWFTPAQRVFELVAFAGLPVAAGIAIFKYRLYDIDVIINRTLVYGVLTAALLASYLLIVVTLSRVLDPVTQDSDIAVAASTLAVAALFGPLRRRTQSFIDRRFYRAKYDAVAALNQFGARLRDEVDLDLVRSDVLNVVASTMQPRHASLWIAAPERGR